MLRTMFLLVSLVAVCWTATEAYRADKPPHILFLLADDLGWNDVGFHGSKIQTPNIDRLASDGVILDNYYVLPICTPTRSALLTGMYPIHTGMHHGVLGTRSKYGLPLNLVTLPQKLKDAGYATHMIGKWHLGYSKWEYTPTYRGFDTFYGSYMSGLDYFSYKVRRILDFRDNEDPVRDGNGTYLTFLQAERAQKIIKSHNVSTPLFLYLAFHNVHSPLQVPKQYEDKYSFIRRKSRRIYAGMVDLMDEAIGNITRAMKDAGLWENTLVIFSTDNGGSIPYGGSNWPLRGGKISLWEGGVRGVSFVHGSMLGLRGVKCKGLVHVTDWFPTLVNLTGSTLDYGQTPLDGMNVWSAISQGEPSPRKEILLNIDWKTKKETKRDFSRNKWFAGMALRAGDMKLLMNVLNNSWHRPPELGGESHTRRAWKSITPSRVKIALYNITADPTEHDELSKKLPDVVKALKKRVKHYMKGVMPSLTKAKDSRAVEKARLLGIWTPWLD